MPTASHPSGRSVRTKLLRLDVVCPTSGPTLTSSEVGSVGSGGGFDDVAVNDSRRDGCIGVCATRSSLTTSARNGTPPILQKRAAPLFDHQIRHSARTAPARSRTRSAPHLGREEADEHRRRDHGSPPRASSGLTGFAGRSNSERISAYHATGTAAGPFWMSDGRQVAGRPGMRRSFGKRSVRTRSEISSSRRASLNPMQ